jgi:hypothetical protein
MELRYRPAMALKDDAVDFARWLEICGYSTNPNYAAQLLQIMKEFDLTQYDVQPVVAHSLAPAAAPVRPAIPATPTLAAPAKPRPFVPVSAAGARTPVIAAPKEPIKTATSATSATNPKEKA